MGVLWVATLFAYASEGVAAPLVQELGHGTTAIGVLLAANPLGVTIGGLVMARLVAPDRRERLVVPLVVLSLAPILAAGLVAVLAEPSDLAFWIVVGLLFVSGLGASWLIPLNVSSVQAVPSAFRGRAFGVAVSGLYGVQAIGALAAGLGAEGVSASGVLGLSGGIGLIAVAPALIAYRRTRGHMAVADATEGPSTA
jgi:MFS family permease